MADKTCQQCAHFRQHYVVHKDSCTPVYCGHCVRPRIKSRKPDAEICGWFLERENGDDLPDRNGVIQFLTEDLLDYIMKLRLPPEVKESIQKK